MEHEFKFKKNCMKMFYFTTKSEIPFCLAYIQTERLNTRKVILKRNQVKKKKLTAFMSIQYKILQKISGALFIG